MNYRYLPVGSFDKGDGRCDFRVWAPGKKKIELVFRDGKNDAVTAMVKDERGYWTTSARNVFPGTHYYYRIDGGKEFPDPASRWQPQGVHGPSAIVDRNFDWTDNDWRGLALKDMIIYELHVGTFSPEGNFEGVINKLDYLKDLGINAIELLPVSQFPGERNWGYDIAFPFAVQHSYGGVAGLKKLVNAAHEKNMAVILDVVYNHASPEGNYLAEFGPYFTEKYKTPWGAAVNLDDAWCYGMRQYILQNTNMWLEEFHIDALRMDAVHALFDTSAQHIVYEIKKNASVLESRTGRRKVIIAEFDLNDPRHITPAESGGYGLDGQWNDEFHHAVHSLITGERNGYYEDFGTIDHLERAFRDTYVYTGQYSVQRKKEFGIAVTNALNQFVVFGQNHDQVGNRAVGDRLTSTLSFEQLKLVAATFLLSPYIPLLFMGEEYGETNPFQYFSDHSSTDLVEIVRKGRKEEFKAFGWQQEPPDPFSIDTFNNSKLSWKIAGDEQRQCLHRFYKYLIRFRKEHKAYRSYERASLFVYPSKERKLLAFEKIDVGANILVVLNYNNQPEEFSATRFEGKLLFDSSSSEWMGENSRTKSIISEADKIIINPYSAVVFEKR
jgi:maltooligosyltrehalose trehalohydrolase